MTEASPTAFWDWVVEHQTRLRAVIGSRAAVEPPILDELLAVLHAYDPGLYFLMGGDRDAVVELIITAEGDVERFAAVSALVDASPQLPGWSFIAFKPAMGFGFTLEHERARIEGPASWFQPLSSPSGRFRLRLACADYVADAEDDFVYAAEMLVTAGLGELAARDIHDIVVVKTPPSPGRHGFLPLSELGGYMQFRASKLRS